MREFDWLSGCVSCNYGCCHNTDRYIPPNECTRADRAIKTGKATDIDNTDEIRDIVQRSTGMYDRRPLECRLFPFDIKEIDGRASWVIRDDCHETPRLDYEKFISFFERKFFREIPVENIMQYAKESNKRDTMRYHISPSTTNPPREEYVLIREVKWPSQPE